MTATMAIRLKRLLPGISLAAGMTAGNFIYQAWQDAPNYRAATDRSFFQAIAVGAAIFVL